MCAIDVDFFLWGAAKVVVVSPPAPTPGRQIVELRSPHERIIFEVVIDEMVARVASLTPHDQRTAFLGVVMAQRRVTLNRDELNSSVHGRDAIAMLPKLQQGFDALMETRKKAVMDAAAALRARRRSKDGTLGSKGGKGGVASKGKQS